MTTPTPDPPVRIVIDTGEHYPALFIYQPGEDEKPNAEIPVPMWERHVAATRALSDAEDEILLYLKHRGELPPRVGIDHLDDRGDTP